MVAILVILTIAVFVLADVFVSKARRWHSRQIASSIHINPEIGLTMADGGDKINPK